MRISFILFKLVFVMSIVVYEYMMECNGCIVHAYLPALSDSTHNLHCLLEPLCGFLILSLLDNTMFKSPIDMYFYKCTDKDTVPCDS